jgi:hypothetical protein
MTGREHHGHRDDVLAAGNGTRKQRLLPRLGAFLERTVLPWCVIA